MSTKISDPSFLEKIIDWATLVPGNYLEFFLKWAIILALTAGFVAWSLGQFLENAAKALDAYKNSGLPLTFDRKKRAKVRRRKQFCTVLNSDLATLAKTENWNDQYFTDLEAEVEFEGEYYLSSLHRLLRRKSRGLRRVPSLIQAIDSSAERALLLVGDPGSGKSVALRHLAHQMAQRGMRSANPNSKVPLYVNLKELGAAPRAGPTADFIKEFVLDNIRRGDADTVSFVRENWEEFRVRGIWFFLFDSFDEIPVVLHAPSGSPVIRQYAEAIRQFMEGISGCRGVLASREYKGPDTLAWQKLRIVPLSQERQEELLENSFLELSQKEVARQHLASSKSVIASNPLFLTLLCRYIREENRAPISDYDLLANHINRLASREEEYISRKYGLSPEELKRGAIELAVLFAEHPEISLAPTRDDIYAALAGRVVPGSNLENLLAALVDVKIGRSDVQEARSGDRRFTFSHRRYQETLFVQHLVENPSYIATANLLTDSRWREYTVTLLQTQPPLAVNLLLMEAAYLLKRYPADRQVVPVVEELGGRVGYYNWQDDPVVPMLTLLQEGMARRLEEVPGDLSITIERILKPRWENGDLYDRSMVIQLGGLLDSKVLQSYIMGAIQGAGERMEDVAFQQAALLPDMPSSLAAWVRARLSDELLRTKKRNDILRLEALSARLPSSIGSRLVFSRCKLLKRMMYPGYVIQLLSALPTYLVVLLIRAFTRIGITSGVRLPTLDELIIPGFSFAMTVMLLIGAFVLSVSPILSGGENTAWQVALGLVAISALCCIGVLYILRAAGQSISFRLLVFRVRSAQWGKFSQLAKIFGLASLYLLLLMVPGFIAHAGTLFWGYGGISFERFFTIAGITLIVSTLCPIAFEVYRNRRWRSRLQRLKSLDLTNSELLLRAESFAELANWFGTASPFGNDIPVMRSLMRVLMVPEDESGLDKVPDVVREWFKRKRGGLRFLMHRIERHLIAAIDSKA